MLNADQRQRLSLLRSMIECEKKEALDALEKNFWDTSMAIEWIEIVRENKDASLEEFHAKYDEARKKIPELPKDRYDVPSSEKKVAPSNRQARRAEMKNNKKSKHKK